MSKKQYQHIFFDLDRTLWDFEKSAIQAFEKIFYNRNLKEKGIPSFEELHRVYTFHNNALWDNYRKGKIDKSELMWLRFYRTLKDFGINDQVLSEKIGSEYLEISPKLVNLFPYTIEILEYLQPKYNLHLITNGFSEVQQLKLTTSGMDRFFMTLITSEMAKVKKPEPGIFLYAFAKTGASPQESIMVGDDYAVDIVGAKNVGMDQIFFDPFDNQPKSDATFRIKRLSEIEHII